MKLLLTAVCFLIATGLTSANATQSKRIYCSGGVELNIKKSLLALSKTEVLQVRLTSNTTDSGAAGFSAEGTSSTGQKIVFTSVPHNGGGWGGWKNTTLTIDGVVSILECSIH